MEGMKRALGLGLALAVLLIPQLDQMICAFCGPGPETSMTAKPVSHSEDDCPLQDGFERQGPQAGDEPTHIHFCTLHSTFLDLAHRNRLSRNFSFSITSWHADEAATAFQNAIDHPPQA